MIKLNKKIIILIFSVLILFSCNKTNNENIESNKIKNISEKENIEIKEYEKLLNKEILNIDKPEGWLDKSDFSIIDNIKRYDFGDNEIDELIKNHNGSIPISIYMKYEPENFVGLIPTVQVNLRPNPTKNFESFKNDISKAPEQFKNMFDNFIIIDEIQEIEVAGIKSVYFKSSFDMKYQDGKIYNITSWTYAIPKGKYFYQINFSDIEGEDNSQIFEKLIKTVQFVN